MTRPPPTLLLVDDEEANRLILGRRLAQLGCQVAMAEHGERALAMLAEQAFDLVLLDLNMPVMDGLATLHAIKADPKLRGMPVVMLTAETARATVQQCLDHGASDYLAKPVTLETLSPCLRKWLDWEATAKPSVTPSHAPATPANDNAQESIDWAALLAHFNGREAFIRKLAHAVLAAHTETPAKLREAARSGDWKTLAFLAHTLKGVGGNMKAPRVHMLGAQAETSARAQQPEAADLALQLADAVEAMITALGQRR